MTHTQMELPCCVQCIKEFYNLQCLNVELKVSFTCIIVLKTRP